MKKNLKKIDRYEIAPGVFRDYVKSHPEYRSRWREVRKKVLERDNYNCQWCGVTQDSLLENPTGITVKDYLNVCHLGDKEQLDLEYLITMCHDYHQKLDESVLYEFQKNGDKHRAIIKKETPEEKLRRLGIERKRK